MICFHSEGMTLSEIMLRSIFIIFMFVMTIGQIYLLLGVNFDDNMKTELGVLKGKRLRKQERAFSAQGL